MAITTNKTWSADQAKNLQTMLNNYGFTDDNGNKLAVDGIAGPKTQQALAKMNTYQQHLGKPDASTAAWQSQLNDWGYKDANGNQLKEDGIFGPKTDAATNEFENGFFDGFTGGTNQKKTVPTQTYPAMPKASDSQIQAAVTPSRTSLTDGWGQSMAYTGMGNQAQNPFAATQKPAQTLQMQNTGVTPYQTKTEQNTASGQNSQSYLDMVSNMNKITDKATADNTKRSFNDLVYRYDTKPGESIEDAFKRSAKPLDKAIYKFPESSQDSGNTSSSDTAIINKAFNEHNRNAGLDKGKVAFLSSEVQNENKDDPLYETLEGISDVYKDTMKTVTSPVAKIIGDYLKDPKNADNVKAMQEQLSKNFQGVLEVFGMQYDEKTGQWYSDDKGTQKYFGYADFYDLLTPLLGFDLETDKVGFDYGDKHYVFRPWFGDYGAFSLVPGGEFGIYESNKTDSDGNKEDHYRIDKSSDKRVRTNIQVYDDKGNQVMSTDDHGQDRYWQFGSNMMAGDLDKDNMYMVATLISEDEGFLNALAKNANENTQKTKILFGKVKPDPNHTGKFIVTYTYDPNSILSRGDFGGGGGSGW